ncbi:hypothetical protein GGTG_00090 [Gaeumannomyces tritici R3-111a-1]|uniref:Uncharacterized protein n=1 Tax=Gaeumannomyces tritici (strain R3-111a-1) TaxID=644352 RepID=J3NFP5_GAET3|nr:hypothetical protein GGTG_00090 [Gaeumannomyces tritici R3-111a-1]EJT80085.1 hypothetical protein GGTG_00090 [Gaeumannomyces tritici R3-111a-1]
MATILVLALALPASSHRGRPRPGVQRRWVRTAALSAYYFFVSGAMAVQLVEMARLTQARLGVSMIPFSVVGSVLAAASLAALQRFMGGEEGAIGPLARHEGIYPVEDQIADNAALAGVCAALAALELVLGLAVLPSVGRVEGVAHIELADK